MVKVFKALSDGTRLRILNILLERECCVCEVMQVLAISQPSASRHLSALYEAGLLVSRKEGIWQNYSIDLEGMPAYAREVVRALGRAFEDSPAAHADRLKLSKAVKQGLSCASA
jgi:ArsR family transcriptional regulator